MSKLLGQVEQLVNKGLQQSLLPIQTKKGILIGDVLIVSDGCLKHIKRNNQILYKNINLNFTAVKLARMLVSNKNVSRLISIYETDQEYGRYNSDCLALKTSYKQSVKSKNFDKADVFWARYLEKKNQTHLAKIKLETLSVFE